MASISLFSVGKTILQKLGPMIQQEAAVFCNLGTELRRMNGTVTSIQALLLDAEEQQEHSHQVKDWLEKLTDLLLDAEDLLDDVALEDMRMEAVARDQANGDELDCRFRCWAVVSFLFISLPNRLINGLKIAHRVKSLREQLDAIYADNTKLHLNPRYEEKGKMRKHIPTISTIPDIVIGREDDIKKIKNLLVSSANDCSDNANVLSVVSIVGIGGMGKTTLAQLIYNDEEIMHEFKLRFWVCVSDAFEVNVIVQRILESVMGEKKQDLELQTLIDQLDRTISREKYLLVLDDVWNFCPEKWDVLRSVLKRGGNGSKILVTTRFENYARTMSRGSHPPYNLNGLSSPQSWSLFRHVVFGVSDHQLDDEQQHIIINAEEIKSEIMIKSAGVPLAVKSIANVLFSMESQTKWLPFLSSSHENSILHHLKLSYDYLPSHLKHCFLHCSLYPKDHEINIRSLVTQWIVLGFIKSLDDDPTQSLYEQGVQCFMDLAWRSFFQEIKRDSCNNVSTCKMHDLIHDLAVSIAGSTYKQVSGPTDRVSEKTCHILLTNHFKSPSDVVGHLDKARRLRTFRNWESESHWDKADFECFISKFRSLRLIDFSRCGLEMVSHRVEELKHLRYINLSLNEKLTRLPDSITMLQNLQVLTVYACKSLEELPRDINRLVNLWYLNCSKCYALTHMPVRVGELTRLEMLMCFKVGKDDGSSSKHVGGLDELAMLNKLRGILQIVNLRFLRENMESSPPSLASKIGTSANLKGKPCLESLELRWNGGEVELQGNCEWEEWLSGSEEDVEWDEFLLESLQPHSNLESLTVFAYKGRRFPSWISSLTNIVILRLECCRIRHDLHHLQELPALQKLVLSRLVDLDYVDQDEDDNSWVMNENPFFPSLEFLLLGDCPKLKGWKKLHNQFPKLLQLFVVRCPLLTSMPSFPTLAKKLILRDTSLQPLIHTMNRVSSSNIQYPLSKLKKLDIRNVHYPLKEWLQGVQQLTSLQEISIANCLGLEETLDWHNISHVPEITVDGYYINKDGKFVWEEHGWNDLHQILQIIRKKKRRSGGRWGAVHFLLPRSIL